MQTVTMIIFKYSNGFWSPEPATARRLLQTCKTPKAISVFEAKSMEDVCYIYIHTAHYNGKLIIKVGITNNLKKRLMEFNTGVKCRFWFERREEKAPKFIKYFNVLLNSRELARSIEKSFYYKNKHKRELFFGNEVYNLDPAQAIDDIKNILRQAI